MGMFDFFLAVEELFVRIFDILARLSFIHTLSKLTTNE